MSFSISQVGGASQSWATSGASSMMGPSAKMGDLFSAMDSSGSGSISKSDLATAFQTLNPPQSFKSMGVDALYQQLDPSGTGSVSKPQFVQTMTSLMSHFKNEASTNSAQSTSSIGSSSTLASSLQALTGLGSQLDIAS